MNQERHSILVAGATGYVGGRLIPELLERGEHVRALARSPKKLQGRAFFGHPNLSIVQGDVLDPISSAASLVGIHTAYYLVHSMRGGKAFAQLDEQAARTFAVACRDAGVSRIIYLSALGRRDEPGLSPHLASRHRTGVALRTTGVPVTELRAAIIVGSGSASYEIIRDLVRHLPVMFVPHWLHSKCEPIAIRDVVKYLVRVLDEPRTIGQELDIGGGEVLTYRQMIDGFAQQLGRRPLIIPVPLLTPRVCSWWLHLITSVDFSIARPLVEGMRNDAVCEDHRIRNWIPFQTIGYQQAVSLALAREREPRRWSHWTDATYARKKLEAATRGVRAPRVFRTQLTFRDYRVFDADCSAEQLFSNVTSIGGENGYGKGVDLLWRARGALDRLWGGPGLRRGRPSGELQEGDPLDFWRIEHLSRPHRMTLAAEMLTPGVARLDFRVERLPDGRSRLHQLATLSGSSPWTLVYWLTLLPVHSVVFPQLGNQIISCSR